jgi:hypothetical protein
MFSFPKIALIALSVAATANAVVDIYGQVSFASRLFDMIPNLMS